MLAKANELQNDNFAVKQHLRYVELYKKPESYQVLTYEDTVKIRDEVAPLIHPDEDEINAVRFDALMYGIELAYLAGNKGYKGKTDLHKKVNALAMVAHIPQVIAQKELIEKIRHTDYLERAEINEFEHIREALRDLIKFIPAGERLLYTTNYDDVILSTEVHDPNFGDEDLKSYKEKAEYYVRQHQNQEVIAKLKTNIPLSPEDVEELETILWSDLGTKEDYAKEYGEKPLGEFVRELVGLDMGAAKAAFAEYLDETRMNSQQIYFVNQIVEYVVRNGMMKDLSVMQDAPFTNQGHIVELFQSNMPIWNGILGVIQQINTNAIA